MSTDRLRIRPATTAVMLEIYSDRATLAHALAFERELARAQAAAGIITADAAARISKACREAAIDTDLLAEEAAHAGTLALALLGRLREALNGDREAEAALHRGATSQDLADTVMMLQAKAAAAALDDDLRRCAGALTRLARRHAATPAMGRTLLRDALPLTFGLRAAQWLAGIESARRRLAGACAESIRLQLGGPVGTHSGQGGKGAEVAETMARALGLPAPLAPWHARRDGVAALAAALAIVAGMLAKAARDVALLGLGGIDEAQEPAIAGRGGSSAMPHKRNPTACQVALSASLRAPGLAATIIAALPQEQERGLGGWQAEAPVLAELFMLAGGSAAAMAEALEGLQVDEAAMARNLERVIGEPDVGESEAIVAAILSEYGEAR